ncbi:MAG: hypothetical protein NTZ25_01295 [Candidatus Peregrinibacteria bacterium]|nr:hypothetical protein [Candidatus Peregrinibacteria bacterium]
MRPEENGSLNAGEVRGESPQSMQFRLASQLEALAGTGINVNSLRKAIETKALGVNFPEVLNKNEKRAEA